MAKNKKELIELLEAAGVELEGEESLEELSLKELKELVKGIPESEEEVEEQEKEDEEVEEEEEESEEPKKPEVKGKFTILDGNGKAVRVAKSKDEAELLAKAFNGRYIRE